MKIVQVTYTALLAFVEQTKANIGNVMAGLTRPGYPGLNYRCCRCADGKTFTHTAFFNTAGDQILLNDLPEFVHFLTALKAAGFETLPKQELLTLVGTSTNIFSA